MGKATTQTDLEALVGGLSAHLPGRVERVDTHGAIILLTAEHAYKLKKPVHFSFFDFRTIEQRRKALAHELELNLRTAPHIYQCVLPVIAYAGGFELGTAGCDNSDICDWVLVMQRFDRAQELDRLADRNELDANTLLQLADQIIGFHRRLPPLRDFDADAAMAEVVRGNAEDLHASCPSIFGAEDIEPLIQAADRKFEEHRPLLQHRYRHGFVRHCHGDIHLGNIVMLNGRPTLFDCIEFNDNFARIDLLYDLAFLLMDLIERGMAPAAQAMMQRYAERWPQDNGLQLLPFLISLRATIRAKVTAFGGDQPTSLAYLELAKQALAPKPACVVAIGGRSGTGKTTIARLIAPRVGAMPGAFILRSDVIRKDLFGRPATSRLPGDAYRPKVSRRVFSIIAGRAQTIAQSGHAVIADAVFGAAWQRDQIQQAAAQAGVPFFGFWLEADETLLIERVEARIGDASDADAAIVRAQAGLAGQNNSWVTLNANHDAATNVEYILSHILRSQ